MKVKEESKKSDLKLSYPKMKIMASGPITSWEMNGGNVESVTDFIFLGSKTTVDGDYSHEIKRHLLLGRKAMTNRQHIKNQRHHFANKGPTKSKLCFFPYSCMDVRVGLERKLSTDELMLLNCDVGEDS